MKKSVITALAIIIIVSLFAYVFSKQISIVTSLNRENEKIKKHIEELTAYNDDLKKNITLLRTDPKYVEKIAREELGMIKESEKIFKFQN